MFGAAPTSMWTASKHDVMARRHAAATHQTMHRNSPEPMPRRVIQTRSAAGQSSLLTAIKRHYVSIARRVYACAVVAAACVWKSLSWFVFKHVKAESDSSVTSYAAGSATGWSPELLAACAHNEPAMASLHGLQSSSEFIAWPGSRGVDQVSAFNCCDGIQQCRVQSMRLHPANCAGVADQHSACAPSSLPCVLAVLAAWKLCTSVSCECIMRAPLAQGPMS
eukprot:359839-Chlamydomonas_euryale.AAC.3